jgi:hypothetical protein
MTHLRLNLTLSSDKLIHNTTIFDQRSLQLVHLCLTNTSLDELSLEFGKDLWMFSEAKGFERMMDLKLSHRCLKS